MRPNDIIICQERVHFTAKSFVLVKELGSGGQGSVWLVHDKDDKKKEYAFKLINERNLETKKRKIENIRDLHQRGARLNEALGARPFSFSFPLYLYEKGDEFGYVMNLCPGKSINRMMLDKKFEAMSLQKRMELVAKIAETADFLRKNGLCYQDFSHKNFMYDDSGKGTVYVIDCDNIAPNSAATAGNARFAGGTGFYAAPEVAFKKCAPSIESDSYALACLFFKIMTGSTDSPYHGKEMYSKFNGFMPSNTFEAAKMAEEDDLGLDWLTFVFDPTNKVNELVPTMFKNPDFQKRQAMVVKNWKAIPENVKTMFYKAFDKPLDPQARKNRPSPGAWMDIAAQPTAPVAKPVKPTPTPAKKPTPPPAPVKAQPQVKFSANGLAVDLKCPMSITPAIGKNGIAMAMGEIEKSGNDIVFRSASPYQIKYRHKTGEDGTLTRGQTVVLKTGTELFFLARPTERVQVTL